jgi:hypothetical protein
MKRRTAVLATEDDLLVDLTFHSVPASLLSEFAEKIVRSHYGGNMNVAIQDLLLKAIDEQDFLLSHITHVKNMETHAYERDY